MAEPGKKYTFVLNHLPLPGEDGSDGPVCSEEEPLGPEALLGPDGTDDDDPLGTVRIKNKFHYILQLIIIRAEQKLG